MVKHFLIFLAFFSVVSCVEKPDIKIRDIRVEGISRGELKMKVFLDIQNPNSFDITLKKINFKMFFDDTNFGFGSWEGSEVLESAKVKNLPITVVADKDMLLKAFLSYFGVKSQDAKSKIRLEGDALIEKLGISYNKSFNWKYKDKKNIKEKIN